MAHCLSKGSYNFDFWFFVFDDIPNWIETIFDDNVLRVSRTRNVSVI